uniref:RNA-binding S4 domain-containing protein n=1 Tax=Triticum urartu TaxID=4572 RepID=A0A8R7K098_TRIUA
MARGLKKHVKRLNAPKHWMVEKLGGAFAPKPSSGPHKARECLPLILMLRNRLKYALTYREVVSIMMQRHIMVDGEVRTDKTYPAGFMDVVSIPKTGENFRLLYDTKGRFVSTASRMRRLSSSSARLGLCNVGRRVSLPSTPTTAAPSATLTLPSNPTTPSRLNWIPTRLWISSSLRSGIS